MFVVCSILGTSFGLALLFLGLDQTTVLSLSFITLSAPLLAQAAGTIFLKEHLTRREKIGTAIAISGTILTIVMPILESEMGLGTFKGNLMILLYMIGDTISLILLKKLLRKGYTSSELTHGSFIVGLFTLLPVGLLITSPSDIINQVIHLPIKYHLGVIYMALLSGTVAYWARSKGQKTIEVGEAALLGYLTPIISSVLAVFILGDRIGMIYVVGAIIILTGVILAETKPKRV
jgi:drug/metabolite transporter (DMT)-like permease